MKLLKKISLGYFCILLFAASLNYIPGLTDTEGRVFGIFALDIFDDSLHVASALWALIGALYSQRSAKMFLVVFGILYLGDGIFGFLTGYGYLDLGIFTNDLEGLSFTLFRFLANLPHIALGGFALWSGLYLVHK